MSLKDIIYISFVKPYLEYGHFPWVSLNKITPYTSTTKDVIQRHMQNIEVTTHDHIC